MLRRSLSTCLAAALTALALGALLLAPAARADVQKVLFVCLKGKVREICPQYRASFKVPEGLVQDKLAGAKQGRVVWVPKGKAFDNAPYVISALVQLNKLKSPVASFETREIDAFKQKFEGTVVQPLPAIANPRLGGPVKLTKLVAANRKPRPIEVIAQFADKDADETPFIVELTLDAQTDATLAEGRAKLEAMIKSY